MSKKERTRYLCSDCGDDFAQWFGRCPSCKQWNTLKEFSPPSESEGTRAGSGSLLASRKPARPSGFFASAAGPERTPLVAPAGEVPTPLAAATRARPAAEPPVTPPAATDTPFAPSGPEATAPFAPHGALSPDATAPSPAVRADAAPPGRAPAAATRLPAPPAAERAVPPGSSARSMPTQTPPATARTAPPTAAPSLRPEPAPPLRTEPAPPLRTAPVPPPARTAPPTATPPLRTEPAPPSSSSRRAPVLPEPAEATAPRGAAALPTLFRLADVPLSSTPRVRTGIHEFDRVLGGGLVPGSVVLIGGDPGIGKSTLLLQAAGRLVAAGIRTLYVTGEESAGQIRLRSERLPGISPNLLIHTETNLEEVAQAVEEIGPRVLIVDSIQTAYLPGVASAPGSITQVREAALALIELGKRRGISILLVGHVTKDGAIAGPKTLEHMVDAVVYMEGERYQHYRILRCVKNRFGGVDELGVFQMGAEGLVEVSNPSQVFLSEHTAGTVGSVVATTVEGTRALLLEVQALVVPSQYANPQRVATGYDRRRLELLLAVLEKRTQLDLSRRDVFVNIAGGLRVVEPGVDLGVLLAVASSAIDLSPAADLVVTGEVGLGGEIRRIAHPERRIQEIARLGYKRALLPSANARDLGAGVEGVELLGVASVAEALETGLNSPTRPG